MRTKHTKYCRLLYILIIVCCSCHGGSKKEAEDAPAAEHAIVGTPVTVTTVGTEPLVQYTDLNATSAFLQKNYVKANVNGYIKTANAVLGKYVTAGQVLFVLKTKEAQSIGNAVNKLDPDFKFSGINYIKATAGGYVTLLSHQIGDYVQDGEQLAIISDQSSFSFLLNLPFELKQYLPKNNVVDLTLPDGTKLRGTVASSMPTVDPASQTQSIVIKVANSKAIPENLIAKVRIIKMNKPAAQSLPKAAVLSNDIQSDFWVMQMTDSNTAVKVPVKKGIETTDKVEILEPKFSPSDKILLTGNYGLPDTAKVVILQKQE
jgi:multidrug efflux pump subunit AcrA (membrane-fusion protein)